MAAFYSGIVAAFKSGNKIFNEVPLGQKHIAYLKVIEI
jgi:hypothetical protein